jgi:hypothetical protein
MEAMVVLLSSPKQQIIDRMFEAHRNTQTRFPMSGILERKAYYQTTMVWSCCVFQKRASRRKCLRDGLEKDSANTNGLEDLGCAVKMSMAPGYAAFPSGGDEGRV